MITVRIDIPTGTRLLPKYLPPNGDLTEWAETGFNPNQLAFLKNRKWHFYLDLEPGEMVTYLEMEVESDREVVFATMIFANATII
jgi:hypothetical protein